jgi:hypothetical protein
MPQRANQVSSELILAASKLFRSKTELAMDTMESDFDWLQVLGTWNAAQFPTPSSLAMERCTRPTLHLLA